MAQSSTGQPLAAAQEFPLLHVSCHAMDLRYVSQPLMVGHYDNDPIAAAEALIDRDIVAGELSIRNRLGLYAGPRGSSTVVLMSQSSQELHQGSCRGAVVIGLGKLGELSSVTLAEAVRVGTLRYLLAILDRAEGSRQRQAEVGLASLLIGQNSTTDIHIEDSLAALLEGVMAANEQFSKAFPKACLRVGRLQLVEVYLDTAITATRCLKALEGKINRQDRPRLCIEPELQFGKGWRHRLDAAQETGYWPRLIVTNAETPLTGPAAPATAPSPSAGSDHSEAGRPGVQLANQLSFSFLGERARAETLHQQRQSGLVEKLLEASIQNPTYSEALSRTLFQLLVPSEFKELARGLEQLVMVLDDTTTNLPWELLLADSQPLALSLAMVRQLVAPRFRPRVRQATSRSAYVIGNPSSEGFFQVFMGEAPKGATALASLDGARTEAERVLQLLEQGTYACECSIEADNGVDVINKLYQQPYRVLHIAGHGVYEQPTRQGDRRSGVVLSDGILITAAEIEAMEVVPDLVFLNCCHLGTVKREPVAFNRLAASVARQLIEMGVRAVVACGWAVDDQAALVFAEEFYTAMLNGRHFGEAVFQARKAAHAAEPDSNTWGAYQAYGDPAYQLEAPDNGPGDGTAPSPKNLAHWAPVTTVELIDRLKQLEVRIGLGESQDGAAEALQEDLRRLLDIVPPSWQDKADVAAAVADVYAAFGGPLREEACRLYLAAIHGHQGSDGLSIRAMEQLANLDARLGEHNNDEPRVERAIERLKALIQIASPQPKAEGSEPSAAGPPPEWQALLGSAYKRLAAMRARTLNSSAQPLGKKGLESVMEPLKASIEAYSLASSGVVSNQLNRLALEAVHGLGDPPNNDAIQQAKTLFEELQRTAPQDPTFWSGVAMADALLTWRLLDRQLAASDREGEAAATEVAQAYKDALANVRNTPLERESVHEQLALMKDLVQARGLCRRDPCPDCATMAARLAAIGETLQSWEATLAAPAHGREGSKGGEDAMEILR